jgi:hypothetical protein
VSRLANSFGIACLAATATGAIAGPPASVSTSADAQVVGGTLNLTLLNPLAFGKMKSTDPGTVVVTVLPQRSATGGVTLIGSGQCNTPPCDLTNQSNQNSSSYWSPAQYTVSGTPGASYMVTAPTTATATLKSGNGAPPTLQVTDVTVAANSSGGFGQLTYTNTDTGTLDPTGQDSIRVGGTLQVPGGLNTANYYLYDVDVPLTVVYN